MILPIYSYGHPILRQKTDEIDANYPDLKALIDNMWETMYNANGVGLAAPQIGLALRLFIIDARPFAADPEISEVEKQIIENFKHVFVNPTVILIIINCISLVWLHVWYSMSMIISKANYLQISSALLSERF